MRFSIRSIMWNIENFYNCKGIQLPLFYVFKHKFFVISSVAFSTFLRPILISHVDMKKKIKIFLFANMQMQNAATLNDGKRREWGKMCEKCKIDKIITQIMPLMGGFWIKKLW